MMCLQLLGVLLLLTASLSGILLRWSEKAGERMRNVKKKSAEVEAKVEQARGALASAEQNRDANEKALAEARSHFHKTEQEQNHVARFPSGCPLDNRISAGQCARPAAAAGNKDASGDVAMGEVDGVDIDLTSRTLTKKPKTFGTQQMQQLRGDMGAQAAKRRKVNLASFEDAATTAAKLHAAAAKAAEGAAGSQGLSPKCE